MSIRNRLLLFLVPVILLLFGMLIFFSFYVSERTVVARIRQDAIYLGASYAQEFDVFTEAARKIAEGEAIALKAVPALSDGFIKDLIKKNVAENQEIYGSTVSLIPGATSLGYYGPYYFRGKGASPKTGGLEYVFLDKETYDYPKWDWFTRPIRDGKGSWSEPFFDKGAGNVLMTTYSALVEREGEPAGVATVDIKLDDLVEKIKKLRVENSGYAFIVSRKGYYIAHPDKELLSKESIWEKAKGPNNPGLKKLADMLKTRETGHAVMKDPFTGEESWITTMPIKSTGWMLTIIYPRDKILAPLYRLRNTVLIISIVVVAFLVLIIILVSSSAVSPISRLVEQTERYASGHFKKRLDERKGAEEIRKLAKAFNAMGGDIDRKIQELNDTRMEVVYRLGRAAEYRDSGTGMHIIRMARYSELLCRAYGMNEHRCDLLLHASPMHDIGKIGIPDSILLKPGRLTEEEWRVIKTHPVIGEKILSGSKSRLLQFAQLVAYTHHEKWDGSGYPRGLKGEEIPVEGRIVAIADVFDSLTSERPYKEAWSVEDAVYEITLQSGKHFDPALVDLFIKILPEIIKIKERFAETKKE